MDIKQICCIGAGCVGGPTAAVIATNCPKIHVTVVDMNSEIIEKWRNFYEKRTDPPIFEPGLAPLLQSCVNANLEFSDDIDGAIERSDLIFICVNTPTKKFGIGKGRALDLTNLESVARRIAHVATHPKIVVEKSTVPIKAAESVERILLATGNGVAKNNTAKHVVLSNPEFLAEGNAISNLTAPDRVLIGGDFACASSLTAIGRLRRVYESWVPAERILEMNTWSAELSKLASNAFLAQRVSSINAIAAICEETGADVRQVGEAIGRDSRIGREFLQPSLGFGGSCFKKDLLSLIYQCEYLKLDEVASYWRAVLDMNQFQKRRCAERILRGFCSLRGKTLAVWGFAFKANTHDTRESPAIDISLFLLEEEAHLRIYDPKASHERIRDDLNAEITDQTVAQNVTICANLLESVEQADGIIVCTEWEEFKNADFSEIFRRMKRPNYVFDGRLILDHKSLTQIGFQVQAIGLNANLF